MAHCLFSAILSNLQPHLVICASQERIPEQPMTEDNAYDNLPFSEAERG